MGIDAKLYDLITKRKHYLGRYYNYNDILEDENFKTYRLLTNEDLLRIAFSLKYKLNHEDTHILENIANNSDNGLYVLVSEDDDISDVLDELMPKTDKTKLINELMLWASNLDTEENIKAEDKRFLSIIKATVDKILKKYENLPYSDITMEELENKHGHEKKDKS